MEKSSGANSMDLPHSCRTESGALSEARRNTQDSLARCDRMLRKAVVFRKPLTTQVKRYGDGWVQRNVNIFPSKIRREMGVRWKQRIPGQSNASCCSASIRVPDSLSGHPHGREKWAARLSFSPITTLDQIDNVPPAYTHYESQVFER